MVALNGTTENGLSVVGRVRRLLAAVDGALGVERAPDVCVRLGQACDQGTADEDLREIEGRLRELDRVLPDFGAESGPLVASAKEILLDRCPRDGAAFCGGYASAPRRLEQ